MGRGRGRAGEDWEESFSAGADPDLLLSLPRQMSKGKNL